MSKVSKIVPRLIIGQQHQDERGTVTFFNDFDMTPVKRQYSIVPADALIVRAWQGHAVENKWFQVGTGKFLVRLIRLEAMQNQIHSPDIFEFFLSAMNNTVLHIPGGFSNGFQSLEKNSLLKVYSDMSLSEALNDEFRFPVSHGHYWKKYEI